MSQPHDETMSNAIPKVVPPLPRENPRARNLPWRTAFDWLKGGWDDLKSNPLPSLLYGLAIAVVSVFTVWGLFRLSLDAVLFPALSGFMVLGPLIANGLYEKSRRLEQGTSTSFVQMIFVRTESGYQTLFLGVMLLGIMLLWMRAAVLIYALYFGIQPFPGFDHVVGMLFTTWTGWSLLIVGGLVGGLFAAFSFGVSVFAVPMLLEEKTDALTAMGLSMAMVWNNLPVMLCWGAIVVGLFAVAVLTAFVGLIVIFPVLGHATWHAYRAMRSDHRGERVFFRPA